MTEKQIEIVQFETDDFYRETVELVLFNMGLGSCKKITNKQEARDIVGELKDGKYKPDIAIVDTYIGINNEDGAKIAAKIREYSPDTKIIGYSIMETEWADVQALKSNKNQEQTIVIALEKILDRKFSYSDVEDPEYTHN